MMPRYAWTVEYNGTTNLSDVQSLSIRRGRVQVQDPFRAATATVTGRNVAALPAIEIGDPIKIMANTTGFSPETYFHGVVADVQITYGEVPAMDTWTIECEDALALLGRSYTPTGANWSAGSSPYTAANNVITQTFPSGMSLIGTSTTSKVSAQVVSDQNVLQLLNQLAATDQAYLYGGTPTTVRWVSRTDYALFPFVGLLTDKTIAPIGSWGLYDQVVFRSQADSYFDQVVVEPEGLAAQTSGGGPRVYTFSSYDETTSQAQDLADYVLGTLQVQQSVPSTISSLSEVQGSDVAADAARRAGTGIRIKLVLRGTVYDLFVEGSTITATPDQARFTLNVISSKALNFFILDSTIFGELDESRLGF